MKPGWTDSLISAYQEDTRAHRIDKPAVVSPAECLAILRLCQEVLLPGYFGHRDLSTANLASILRPILEELHQKLHEQAALCHPQPDDLSNAFMEGLPELRRLVVSDAQAAVDGDPAATGLDEVLLAYPGYLAVFVYRIAHRLHQLGAPLMARILSEWAHAQSGADIHPAAQIGESFFIDHASGVVIGATSVVGKRVRLYQGVTLGALSLPRGEDGKVVSEGKRHPTLEDDVTLYANAIVLGGQTVVGRGSVIGGAVFLTRSVPPDHRVILDPPKLRIQGPQATNGKGQVMTCEIDFEI